MLENDYDDKELEAESESADEYKMKFVKIKLQTVKNLENEMCRLSSLEPI